jgi:hypothetical protein
VAREHRDPLDVDLDDEELREEVDLLMRLIEAAAGCAGHLQQAAIDAVLFDGGAPGG